MKYLSVCSGIEAASVAWHPLKWTPLAFSEIETFPRKVLAHHYPDVPCHGDFTMLRHDAFIKDADVLVGGTPCQAFSIAGLRQSLADDRGNLSLEFVRLANAIDDVRPAGNGCIIVWENVVGVLSVKDNAFGCFLAALVGNDAPLVPTGGKWTNAGMVIGPQRSAAWRVLDAQYFGVAQRRRRVFVVASARDGFDPAEVLFEREGVRRDIAPRRGKGEASPSSSARCFDRQRSDEYGEADVASTISARDYKSASDLVSVGFYANQGSHGNGNNQELSVTLKAGQKNASAVASAMTVRRLTPRECERLQGFPDDYTAIPGFVDGPRYKALGNSMAVPVMNWIGKRIDRRI